MLLNIKHLIMACSMLILSISNSSHASVIAYEFDIHSLFGNINQTGQGPYDNKTYFSGNNGIAKVQYDSKTQILDMQYSGIATIDTRRVTPENDRIITGHISDSSHFSGSLRVENATFITNPEGIAGLSLNNSVASGSMHFTQAGDINNDGIQDSLSFDYVAADMDFFNMANAESYHSELFNIGSANFFMWESDTFASLASVFWMKSMGDIYINGGLDNGSLVSSVHGDLILTHGKTQIPEPSTVLLLGSGMLGMFRRKKSENF